MKIERVDEIRSRVVFENGMVATLFAAKDVFIDGASIKSLEKVASIRDTVFALIEKGELDTNSALSDVVLTPDFHKGTSVPIGTVLKTKKFVLPAAAGNDIGCGMACFSLNVEAKEIESLGKRLDDELRHAFFEGGRHVEFTSDEREEILVNGVQAFNTIKKRGTLERMPNGWERFSHNGGKFGGASFGDVFNEWIAPGKRRSLTRDSFMGTIGGGNHFVEIQSIDKIYDSTSSWELGLKSGNACVMAHSGSLSLGRAVAMCYLDMARNKYPNTLKYPDNEIFPLSEDNGGEEYISEMKAASHFATMNRITMGIMVITVLEKLLKREIDVRLVHDLPHNLVWKEGEEYVHRKGACPSIGPFVDENFLSGCPVLIPGSMGTESHILKGLGSEEAYASCPHGAGRVASRNTGRAKCEIEELRVVTKIDMQKVRRDIANEYKTSLSEEAPKVYKDIKPIIETVEQAGMASRVVSMKPILTIKG